ncbi:Predicted dehydrogenase [Octadecabacter temperatus]|uniref:Inositol 2-dehydrogenase/D-chiro-inositol 3-dehydrogenase n=1 Tax=Octadecabacter temperatus TaxID=1458307 RepID=A0A0K0Y7J1_9RHOB|nr:Gfo/Idh/MocA family oxidoreductase [Octadecabacter temperatus]AKS46880.1 Inositol 2-dehydrogenase/D-chiro-inositol 3-dehydrogenase [Octadecabacter temperatus]SIO22994.1 Predicted dehydrogenase [Octadecabacter temperatus]
MVILVIGAGSIGRRHADNLKALGEVAELIPWRSYDRAALEKRNDVKGVVIATATQVRLELVTLCAAKGWPFYVEKPLHWTAEGVAEIYDAAGGLAKRSMLGFMARYHPVVKALAADDLTDVYGFSFEIGHDVRQWRQNWSFPDSYAAKPEGGGVLLDLCHELDLAKALFPDLAIQSVASVGHADFGGVDFASRIALTDSAGRAGTVAMDYLSPVSLRRSEMSGTRGLRKLDMLAAEITRDDGNGPKVESFEFDRNDMFRAITRDWLALIENENAVLTPLAPRLSDMRASSDLIADAWGKRVFSGSAEMTF